jgi:hypothetical protein
MVCAKGNKRPQSYQKTKRAVNRKCEQRLRIRVTIEIFHAPGVFSSLLNLCKPEGIALVEKCTTYVAEYNKKYEVILEKGYTDFEDMLNEKIATSVLVFRRDYKKAKIVVSANIVTCTCDETRRKTRYSS